MFPKEKKSNMKLDIFVVEKFLVVADFHYVIKCCRDLWLATMIDS